MQETDFINMLLAHQECMLDEKKFRAILNDFFPTNVQMNNILVNLFHLGLPREIEELNVIGDPVYYKYKKKVVKIYGIDQKLADDAIRMWIVCYGERVLKRKIKISAIAPDVPGGGSGTEWQPISGVKERNFNNCPFKLSLPKISVLDGVIKLSFTIMPKAGISVDISLNEVYLSDKLNRKYDNYFMGKCKPKEKSSKSFVLDIPIPKRNFYTADAGLILYFLAGDGRRYEISYIFRKNAGTVIDYVMSRKLSLEEKIRLQESLGQAEIDGGSGKDGRDGSGEGGTSGGSGDQPIYTIPKIEEYKKAVLREKFFLQKEGGRKYKVTNGNLLNSKNGLCTYSFEMESELNLSDDAPITLSVGLNQATGSVLVCEGFQIIVVIDKDFGTKISQAMIGVEPWKLLEALVKKLDPLNPADKLALKLIQEGPGLATKDPASSIPKGQSAAISAARRNDITVIWGPPGTGKTYTMAQIAKEQLQKGKSILIVSHSNVSVDGVIKQTVATLRNTGMGQLLKDGKVLRYGYVRDEELSQDSYAVAYNYVLNHRPDLQKRLDQLRKEREQLRRTGGYNSYASGQGSQAEHVERELKKLRAEVRTEERQYVSKAKLVATTISKVTIDSLFDDEEYDIVMFDEVSMAYVPQIVCAAMYAKEKLVLVGDFRQLAPIVQSDAKSVLGVDIFSYLGISRYSKVAVHPWLVMLNEQRRMHPDISAFPNKYVYNKLLLDHDSVQYNRADIIKREPLSGNAINLINLSGTYCAAMKNSDNSRFNIVSAIVSFLTALAAEESGEKSIGIITPYAAQTRIIRAMIQDYRQHAKTDIACSTVHQFQGSERDVIIFDAVESYPASKVGWLMGKEFDSVTRLINVAVTRARGKLIVIANATFWENKFKGSYHIFYNLVDYLMKSGNVVSTRNKNLTKYIQGLPFIKNLCYYDYLRDAIEDFKLDVDKAQDKIVISIADGKLDAETQASMLKIVQDAERRGIRILCKTGDYEELPEGWKKYTWASENAAFPLIMIDDKVAWYGLPKSRGMFKDGNSRYLTVNHTWYRIKGEHTLEMIKAFSDFEYRVVNGVRKPLLEKGKEVISGGGGDGEGKGAAGLDRFVRQMQKCPECKSPMMVTRSMKGKVYLKCTSPNCKHIEYLTPEITNWYITKEHVTCPIHHCGIQAGVGKYGIYVRCDAGHFLKPDEI